MYYNKYNTYLFILFIIKVPEGDECIPNPCGPNSGCRSVNGLPSCFCLPEFEGNPPTLQCTAPENPCSPSPCGPNTQCSILSNGFAKCTCLTGYIESPNTIRGCVEPRDPCDPNPCGLNAICDASRNPTCYCPEQTVGNPFRECAEPVVTPELCRPGPCGRNADCYVASRREECYCKSGYIGDPYSGCREIPKSACEPNPCGPGAQCIVSASGSTMCTCPDGMGGDPTSILGCHGFECRIDEECANNQACIGHRCRDPCPGSCGTGAHCKVEKHHPVCFCNTGLIGNPLTRCYTQDESVSQVNPCMPNPCGPNTQCVVKRNKGVCSCLPDYLGNPKSGCRPECTVNSDCPSDRACINKKCQNPCAGNICGVNAECKVIDHTASCECPSGFNGDAFFQCISTPIMTPTAKDPCQPSPCDASSLCVVYGDGVAICDRCAGPAAFNNPQCRPECVSNSECPFDKACLGQKCLDPCPGSCGHNAICNVVSHNPICSCPQGLNGSPYEHCSPTLQDQFETCNTIKCGYNAECSQNGDVLACTCKKDFFGNPLVGCRPECVINPDCASNEACVNNKCKNPCIGACGVGALCEVVNHYPVCYCGPNQTGDAFLSCTAIVMSPLRPKNPCDPSPCGPNSRCLLTSDGTATCSCLPGYRGVPPVCQPECVVSSECAQNKACVNMKCIDPCPGTCGSNARCEVLNHNPICSCPPGQSGDPFVVCQHMEDDEQGRIPISPCNPSPCGPNSICQIKQGHPVCSCTANFIGSPPYCRPECLLSHECPQDKACIKEKCQNPCNNVCGANAQCHVVSHSAFCNCVSGYEGDAFVGCTKIRDLIPMEKHNPCSPNPCGENTQCSESNGIARCSCIPPYIGDPYKTGCRPECVFNSDCSNQQACILQHCRDPCIGVCGTNAECIVANHVPVCSCPRGMQGDPFIGCRHEPIICKYNNLISKI